MNKGPITKDEPKRINALHTYDILDTEQEADFDRITQIASLVCGTSISLISLIDSNRQWFKSKVGIDLNETTRDLSFCQYAIADNHLMEVKDARNDDRFKDNQLVTSSPHIRYYAGMPLIDPNGYALGTLCVIDSVPKELTEDQKRVLALLRDEAVALIVNRKEKGKYKESEEKLKAFFDNSQGLMCTHDLQGKLLTVNEAGAKILGYSRAALEKLSLFDVVPVEAHDNLKFYLSEIASRGTMKGEMRTTTRSGDLRIWMFNNILQNRGDKNPYVIGNAVDITEQHYLEKHLKNTQAMLERTSRVARIGGWEYCLEDGNISWSDMTKEIHEVPIDFKPTLESALSFYKEGISRTKIQKAIDHTIATGNPWDLELEIVTYLGQDIWVRALGNADFINDRCVRLYGTFQDIDKRKRSEAESSKSKKLLEDVFHATSAVCIIVTDIDGIITLFNKGAENLLGYNAEEVIGKISPISFHIEHELVLRAKELGAELGGEVSGFRILVEKPELYGAEQREWTYVKKDDTLVHVSLAVTVIRDNEGNIVGYLGVATDISKIAHQREELEKAKLLAEQGSVAKSEFLANMSHEIRTPLNGIIGFTDLLTRTALDVTQREYISIVDQSANLLLGIINDILDFSKIEAGKLDLDVDKNDLYELVMQVTSFLNVQINAKKLDFEIDIATDVPHSIWIDALRIKQVLMNLLSNAVKFTEKGKVTLGVSLLSHESERAVLRFSVKDTGIGIKADKQEKIFDAFSQEDTSTTKRYGGTGLGLTISNKLLKMMGSELKLESTLGVGSQFFFDISLKATWQMSKDWNILNEIKHAVIVVEDDSESQFIVNMLSRKGVEVTPVKNGLEALQLLRREGQFDILIIDNDIPIMNGIETIKKLNEKIFNEHYRLPIIPLFGRDESELVEQVKMMGLTTWLFKPMKVNDLYDALSKSVQEKLLPPPSAIAEAARNRFKILIIEDNEFNMFLARTIILNIIAEVEIFEAIDGFQGLALFHEKHPDLVLTDIQMPKLNGYEVARSIRREEVSGHTPIIALTAGNIKGEREKCLESGMDDFLVKPIIENTLRETLIKWLNIPTP
ncbi:response regulator [Sphingobacterium sp.]|jgi:PAS domain S-box-containing protein|uniref:response regulator n=1 Tax=Sphingobacterium sp. TaxID=341027 RepID=UPI00289EE9E1|nr:response regulator [Sphingobacterium sp.]